MMVFYGHSNGIPHVCPKEDEACEQTAALPGTARVFVRVDRCILPDVKAMWALGIRTVCSCCGHGGAPGYIVAAAEDAEKARAGGWEEAPPLNEHCAKCGVFFRPKYFDTEVKPDV